MVGRLFVIDYIMIDVTNYDYWSLTINPSGFITCWIYGRIEAALRLKINVNVPIQNLTQRLGNFSDSLKWILRDHWDLKIDFTSCNHIQIASMTTEKRNSYDWRPISEQPGQHSQLPITFKIKTLKTWVPQLYYIG